MFESAVRWTCMPARSLQLQGARALLLLVLAALTACAGGSRTILERSETPQSLPPPSPAPTQEAPSVRTPIVIEGTGALVGAPPSPRIEAALTTDGYQLTFIDTEIASVVASVIGDGLGLSYAVDPQVRGTMTLQAARPLARDEVLPALEAALNVHGAALVYANGVYQVVPMKDAPRRISGLRGPGQQAGAAGFAVEIIPIKYVSVADVERTLRPFAPEGGILRVDEGRNLIVLAGTSRELAMMRDLVNTFDVNWLAGMSFALFPVEYVDVKTLADELSAVFADQKSPIASVVRLVPLSRLNSLMVVTHEPSYLKEVETWIRRLDIGTATPGRRIYVYDVQNGKADDLAESLSKILSIAVEVTPSGTSGSMIESNPNGSFGAQTTFNRVPSAGGGPASTGATATASSPGSLKIVPNTDNNALLIYATPSEFAVIESALRRLDVTPIQVLIEASLAEVSLTDDLRYGLQWAYEAGDGPLVLSEAANGAINPSFPGFSYLYTGRADIQAVLNAIETMTNVNVISSPKLLVLNNREAEMQIGDQVPIVVQSSVSTVGETAPIVNSVQLRDTGVILRITPRVNKTGLVLLDVAQEVSDVVPTTTSNIDSPTIQQRRIASTVAVRSGETIALGGLIRDSRSRTRSGIPYVSRLPIIGDLFGSTSKNSRRTELIVLITPRVIRSQQETKDLMDDLREQFRALSKTVPQWREQADAKDEGAGAKHEPAGAESADRNP